MFFIMQGTKTLRKELIRKAGWIMGCLVLWSNQKTRRGKMIKVSRKFWGFLKKIYFLGGKKKERLDAGKGGREKGTKKMKSWSALPGSNCTSYPLQNSWWEQILFRIEWIGYVYRVTSSMLHVLIQLDMSFLFGSYVVTKHGAEKLCWQPSASDAIGTPFVFKLNPEKARAHQLL